MKSFIDAVEAVVDYRFQQIWHERGEHPGDGVAEALTVGWLKQLAADCGYAVDVDNERDGEDDCYPRVNFTVRNGDATIALYRAIDCVCGAHGLRNGSWEEVVTT